MNETVDTDVLLAELAESRAALDELVAKQGKVLWTTYDDARADERQLLAGKVRRVAQPFVSPAQLALLMQVFEETQ